MRPGLPRRAGRNRQDRRRLVEASAPEGHGRAHRDGREERECDADGEAPSTRPLFLRAAGGRVGHDEQHPREHHADEHERSLVEPIADDRHRQQRRDRDVEQHHRRRGLHAAARHRGEVQGVRDGEAQEAGEEQPAPRLADGPPAPEDQRGQEDGGSQPFLNRLAAAGETLPWDRSLENAIDAKAQLAAAESAARTGPVATAPEGSGIGGSAPQRADPDPGSALGVGLLGGLGLDGDALARLLAGEQVLARTHTDLADAASAARGAACFELGLRHGSCGRRAPPSGERPKRVGRPPSGVEGQGGNSCPAGDRTPAGPRQGPRSGPRAGRRAH